MREKILIFVIILTSINIKAQDKPKDSIENPNSIEHNNLPEQTDKENIQNYTSTKVIDSLEKELLFYRAKEDYYSVALSEQATRFTLIISGILGLLALVSFGIFKYEIQKIKRFTKKKLRKQTEEFETQKNKLKNIESNLITSQANISATIGIHYRNEKMYVRSVMHHLYSAIQHSQANETEKDNETNIEVVKANIGLAKDALDNLIKDDNSKESLREEVDDIRASLNKLIKIEDEEIKDEVSEFRLQIKEYLK